MAHAFLIDFNSQLKKIPSFPKINVHFSSFYLLAKHNLKEKKTAKQCNLMNTNRQRGTGKLGTNNCFLTTALVHKHKKCYELHFLNENSNFMAKTVPKLNLFVEFLDKNQNRNCMF